jgi:hypothetical protein
MALMKETTTTADSEKAKTLPKPDNGQYLCSMERQ